MSEHPLDPSPSTLVNLGDEGLSDGDQIDTYLNDHWAPDTHITIPGGTYTISDRSLLNTDHWSQDAIIEGEEGATVEIQQPEVAAHVRWLMDGGDLVVRNLRFTGKVANSSNPYTENWTEQASAGSFVKFEELEFPDGSNTDTRAKGMVVDPASTSATHEGEAWFINCQFEEWADNGLYASYPGESGAGGSTHVRGGMYRNNNIANIRLGGHGDSLKQATSIVDDANAVPFSSNGYQATRCLRVSGDGDNIDISGLDCTATATLDDWIRPLDFEPPTDGAGSGTLSDTRIETSITAYPAIRDADAGSWSCSGIHITGSGDLTNELGTTACSGSGCDSPTTSRQWWDTLATAGWEYWGLNPNTTGDTLRIGKVELHGTHPFGDGP